MGSFIRPKKDPETRYYPEYVLRLQREPQICQKSIIVKKPLSKPVKSLRIL